MLVLLLNQSREQQAGLALPGIPPHLERILTITGLRTAFQVEASVEEAIQVVQAAPRPRLSSRPVNLSLSEPPAPAEHQAVPGSGMPEKRHLKIFSS
ncbi:hypothetical protein AB0L05_00860 [Nonomuraea pusilla]|uniref:hypothetical protein n=1 Tax=Nonomuraea pusilla TaxID=46177 RepID=UPI0033189AD8